MLVNMSSYETSEIAGVLSEAWHVLRLSVRCPSRFCNWDAIVVTAASEDQAELFTLQLKEAKSNGIIAQGTTLLAVPDPDGRRIGSGTATFHALCELAKHVSRSVSENANKVFKPVHEMRVLLLHTGGDSKRVPWANCFGKAFLPLPFLAKEDPDAPVPKLFDHILAISSCVLQNMSSTGGLLIMAGDVLPCFDASDIPLPTDGVCVVTVPTTPDIASKHGVIISSDWKEMSAKQKYTASRLFCVDDLCQKPSVKEAWARGALDEFGKVLLDTGIFSLHGKAWENMIKLALELDPVKILLANQEERWCPKMPSHGLVYIHSTRKMYTLEFRSLDENPDYVMGSAGNLASFVTSIDFWNEVLDRVSLYEEVAGAWVAARHGWLQNLSFGKQLIKALGSHKLHHYCSYGLKFLHFGTSGEVLDHLAEDNCDLLERRHLSAVASSSECEVAPSAILVTTEVLGGVSIGDQSLVFDCTLGQGVQIGMRCVIMGVHTNRYSGNISCGTRQRVFTLPDSHCLWEIPLRGEQHTYVTICCGIEDNPKCALDHTGTYCGKPWRKFMSERGLVEEDLWPLDDSKSKDLWTAKLFPILVEGDGFAFAMWLMGVGVSDNSQLLNLWRKYQRLSLSEIHSLTDFVEFHEISSNHRSRLAAAFARASIESGLMGRNFAKLCSQMLSSGDKRWIKTCQIYSSLCAAPTSILLSNVPTSRTYQARLDFCKACRDDISATSLEKAIWQGVTSETMSVLSHHYSNNSEGSINMSREFGPYFISCLAIGTKVEVKMPVRVDFAGGWSDTPPWSLERIGCVLNMAILLDSSSPVGAEVTLRSTTGVTMADDAGHTESIEDLTTIALPLQESDQFRLVKAALIVMGLTNDRLSAGLIIKTWANVPRGNGLGTSSILAVAVIKALLRVTMRDEIENDVASLVLGLEQLMGVGGGWQDQIGALYPGVKCTTSFPGRPLKLNVETIQLSRRQLSELEDRIVLLYTGQTKTTRSVLEQVVRQYLQRDARLISIVKRLTKLAKLGQRALMSCDLDKLGSIMLEAWKLNQELDPNCSNLFIDKLFKEVSELSCGYKLAGAGGGGFAIIMAKGRMEAEQIKQLMKKHLPRVQIYDWSIYQEEAFWMKS